MLLFSLFLTAVSAGVPHKLQPRVIGTVYQPPTIDKHNAQGVAEPKIVANAPPAAAVAEMALATVAPVVAGAPISSDPITIDGIPISLPAGLTKAQLQSFKPFNKWLEQTKKSHGLQSFDYHPFNKEPFLLHSIEVQGFDMFGKNIGFVKIKADIHNSKDTLPGIALLRGASVGMLVVLTPDAPEFANERYVLLTTQPRVAAGSLAFTELPAGMTDGNGNFKVVAGKEIKEELHLDIDTKNLISLTGLASEAIKPTKKGLSSIDEGLPFAMFPSAGGCDEYIELFAARMTVSRKMLEEWQGKETGETGASEKITVKVVPMENLWMEGLRDAKTLSALLLWEKLEKKGLLPGMAATGTIIPTGTIASAGTITPTGFITSRGTITQTGTVIPTGTINPY